MKYQNGSLRKKQRKSGEQVWEFRYRDSTGTMRQKTLPCANFSTLATVKVELQSLVFSLNDPTTMNKTTPFGMVIERFITEENLREIAAQEPGVVTVPGVAFSTAKRYLSYFECHFLPRWGDVAIEAIKPLAVKKWIEDLDLAGLTKAGIKAMMHCLFERAMLWELVPIERNPMSLFEIRGSSVRKKKKVILTVEQFQELREMLPEPYKTMVTLAICTGLRVSEVTALRWEHIKDGSLIVQAGAYHGRIGAVKTQASNDEIPLHPDILIRMIQKASGLIFPSPRTGGTFHGGKIQQHFLRPAGRKLLGVDNLGWHAMRHTYRTLLDECEAPMGVQQKLMRHANIATTMNVYGNSTRNAKRDANSKVVEMVVGRAS